MANIGSQRRSLTGIVTKLVGDNTTYGFINDEIFFQQAIVVHGPASIGDQVLVECEYSAHMPIKWNATSVKILNKAVGGGVGGGGGANVGDARPSVAPESGVGGPQGGQSAPVASTYQQHRQQRELQRQQQQQLLQQSQHLPQPPSSSSSSSSQQQQQQQQQQQPMDDRPQEQPNFFLNQQPQQQQEPLLQQQVAVDGGSVPPFAQDQPPMGPPNFAFTSQLGSAFVQPNQFVPPPFITQQHQPPPSMLNPQQPPPGEIAGPLNSTQPFNRNDKQQHNKNMGLNRFSGNNNSTNNSNNTGNSQLENRKNSGIPNRNNNDGNKYERPNSSERNNTFNSTKPASNRPRDIADKGTGRNSKRDNVATAKTSPSRTSSFGRRDNSATRNSPPLRASSSARSTTSVSSDKGSKNRKHYNAQHIPKTRIMSNMTPQNMKFRCPSSVHVPSDLKEVAVNSQFRLNIKNMPKPIRFSIEPLKSSNNNNSNTAEPTKTAATPAPSKTVASSGAIKMDHKYGVKVLLMSLPDWDDIYKGIFGQNLDSFTSDSRPEKGLDTIISFLCNKGSNEGYSLVGGKFDPNLDGFVEGQANPLERNDKVPDLIATCKRVVSDQTGLDLSNCRSWTLLSTFMYNNKSDYFSSKASVEYSYIYLPEIWTCLRGDLEQIPSEVEPEVKQSPQPTQEDKEEKKADVAAELVASGDATAAAAPELGESQIGGLDLLSLKVTDLKGELDRRNIAYKGNAKKAELVALLQQALRAPDEQAPSAQETQTSEPESKPNQEQTEQLVAEKSEKEPPTSDSQLEVPEATPVQTGERRKTPEDSEEPPAAKRACIESREPLELVKDTLTVFNRTDQQTLSLVSLQDAARAGKHDQFELSVASIIVREALVQHFSEYILSTLVEDQRERLAAAAAEAPSINSDSNNNTSKSDSSQKAAKNDSNTSQPEMRVNLKEQPVDRYVNLAFSYFDTSHLGYIYSDDLSKLFDHTGYTLSKRGLLSLIGDGEKFNYRTLPDLSPKHPPSYKYEFPQQFYTIPGSSLTASNGASTLLTSSRPYQGSPDAMMIEFRGVTYNIEQLIQQVREAETLRVSLVDRFNYAIQSSDKQAEEIHVLEVSQKSLSKAIKAQNDEICELKRERDSIKKKCESFRKGIKGTMDSLSELLKDDK